MKTNDTSGRMLFLNKLYNYARILKECQIEIEEYLKLQIGQYNCRFNKFLLQKKLMNSSRLDKNCYYQTNLSYQPTQHAQSVTTDRSSNLDKENIIPCGAQMQSLISALNQKKYQLKNLLIQRQKFEDQTVQQTAKLEEESIKQSFDVEGQVELMRQNTRILDEVQSMKKQKLKNMQKMLPLKKCLESRFQQILEMKKLFSDLQEQTASLEQQKNEIQSENSNLIEQNNQLDLISQSLDNQVMHMRQTVRQSEVASTTVQSALGMFNQKINCTLNETKNQNHQTRSLNALIKETGDKIKKRKQQKTSQDINSSELMIKNKHIEEINMKLRSDLLKCQGHLQCVLKNNEILSNSIEEFTFVDSRVTKLINRNELKKL